MLRWRKKLLRREKPVLKTNGSSPVMVRDGEERQCLKCSTHAPASNTHDHLHGEILMDPVLGSEPLFS